MPAADHDFALEQFLSEHYSSEIGLLLCAGTRVEPTPEAIRDAFFNGVRAGWRAAVEAVEFSEEQAFFERTWARGEEE